MPQGTDKRLKRESRLWADLLYDILFCIMGHLCFADQIRFRAVCKNWRLVSGIKPKDKLPWILTLNFNCNHDVHPSSLYDPCSRKSYELVQEIRQSTWRGVGKLQVCSARNGWLLVAEIPPLVPSLCFPDFYLFNPFTDEGNIKLPYLPTGIFRAAFTSNPTSQDCLFFAIHDCSMRRRMICISTCHRGDRNWTEWLSFEGFSRSVIGVFYLNGIFYCVFKTGKMGTFDPVTKSWSFLAEEHSTYSELESLFNDYFEGRVVESDGEVFIVYSKRNYKPWHIFRLDWIQMQWVKEVSLDNRVIFLGDPSYLIQADGELEELADRIYYHGYRKSYFYPVKSGTGRLRSHSLQRQSCEHYDWRSPYMVRVWIEPPMLS